MKKKSQQICLELNMTKLLITTVFPFNTHQFVLDIYISTFVKKQTK